MNLIYQPQDHSDLEMDFLEALRQCDADNFTGDKRAAGELRELREDLLNLDRKFYRICILNPALGDRYQEQYDATLEALKAKIARLGIPRVTVA
jgi:hypothetical protein